MKTFTQIINESSELSDFVDNFDYKKYFTNCLEIKRDEMPQIFDEHFSETISDLQRLYGVEVTIKKLSELFPTQCEVNEDKIKSKLMTNEFEISGLKFITSDDYHIADGHHSHVAGLIRDPEAEVQVYKVDCSTRRLINALNRMKHVENMSIDESVK